MDNNLQNDFISTVSHELRTPLTSIRGFAQTMLSSWDALDDANKKKFIKIIEEQSNRLINLVENVLSVNKLQSFSDNFVYKSHKIKPLIESVIQVVSQQYPTHKFTARYDAKLPEVYFDSDKFQQIMTNLIENGAKYSDENSTIEINVGFSSTPEFASITVKDYGIGISEQDYEKIFNKFSRIDNYLTRKVQGSGLGLYITKTLVLKMGGTILVSSNENGSAFTVLLPFANVENQAKQSLKE